MTTLGAQRSLIHWQSIIEICLVGIPEDINIHSSFRGRLHELVLRGFVEFVDVLDSAHDSGEVDGKLGQVSSLGIVHQCVNPGRRRSSEFHRLESFLLHDSSLEHVDASLDDVQLDKSAVSIILVRDHVQRRPVETVDISNATEPVLKESKILSLLRRYKELRYKSAMAHCPTFHSAAVVVSAYDYVFDAKMSNGIL